MRLKYPSALIINGYGHEPKTTPLGPYLQRMLRRIYQYSPTVVVPCGGPTQRKRFGSTTEAEVIAGWLENHMIPITGWDRPKVLLVNDTYSDYENSRGASVVLREYAIKLDLDGYTSIVHGCEADHAVPVKMADRHFMADLVKDVRSDITMETDSWERADPERMLRNIKQMRRLLKYPFLAKLDHYTRKRRAARR